MIGRKTLGWSRRAFGMAWIIGLCAAFSPGLALSQVKDTAAAAEAERDSSPPLDDALTGLFTPDGALVGSSSQGASRSRPRTNNPALRAPAPRQVRALEDLQREAEVYQRDAKDYRDTITKIVKQHYEERRKRVLTGLDQEINTEKRTLNEARNEAIRRLEDFVSRYSGANSQPEASPDAMYRLAALYDERARDSTATDISEGLRPAVALYKRIIREYPQYKELSGVYYYLGHALFDSNRLEEAQQVWRSLVCHNLYPYPVARDPKDPDRDQVADLPQDHDPDFWINWRHQHPTPDSLQSSEKQSAKQLAEKPAAGEGENSYRNPFPDTCTPVYQKPVAGHDPRYLAEVWWKIGDWYFDETDPKAGPYSLNRAVSAYQKSIQTASTEKGVLYGVSMYKLAWTYFKQQRYEASTRQFVELLRYTDAEEKRTGGSMADFRAEAYTYIAGSLTYVDFRGPRADEPLVPRADVLDQEQDPRVVEQKMRVAIQRVQDTTLIPQDQPWTVEVYKALSQEYRDLNQLHNRIDVSQLILDKWPMHRDAPQIQFAIAETYDELTRLSREGSPEHRDNAAKALDARSKLAAYVGNTPWVNANRDDPEAIQVAERLVRGGLQRAAAEHTNLARAYVQRATETGDQQASKDQLRQALVEYRLAEKAWSGYIEQDENAPDAYESRFWLADARHWLVAIKVELGNTPSVQEVLKAREAAIDVRDSNEDDRRLEAAAYYAVNLAFLVQNDRMRVYRESNGVQGTSPRTEVRFVGEGKDKKVASDPIPPPVRFLDLSQQEYIDHVPPALDVNHRSPMFQFQIAESFFYYGQFDEARKRFEPIYREECGKSEFGYRAWERLLTMSNLSGDVERSRVLAQAQKQNSCAVSAEQKTAEALLINPTLQEAAYMDARKAFEQAQKMPDGPERAEMWRKAAALYNRALENAPDRDEAPEAAINGAFAYKQVGEYDKAISMYELFINRYGDDKALTRLQKGDPKANPPVEASPEKYSMRLKFLKQAYDALSASYVLFFNYRKAAEEYDKISQIERFEQKDRRDAARNALTLYANMGDKTRTEQVRQRLGALGASPEEKAEADFVLVRSEMNEWDERGRDEGANRAARLRATAAMQRYHDGNAKNRAAAPFVVQAAYNVAKLKKAGDEKQYLDWYKKTIDAFERYRATAPVENGRNKALGSLQAGMAAEAEYALLDLEIRQKFDYDSGHHRYQGTTVDVIKKYRDDASDAQKYHERLQHVIDAYLSPEWVVAARARQGSLYDSLRTGLYNARAPGLKLFTDKEEKLLSKLEQSDNPEYQDRADQFRQARREAWRTTRDKELADADKVMVVRYVESVALGRKYNVSNGSVDHAVQRLAFFTDVLGDEKLRAYTQGIDGFAYADGVFLRSRPGIIQQPEVQAVPNPLPVVPQ